MNAKISESLGLVTISEANAMEILPPVGNDEVLSDSVDDAQAEADRQYARENMKEIIEQGTGALDAMLDIARATEDPRAFEVFSSIMKTLIDANKSLVGLNNNSARKSSKSQKDNQDENKNTTTNNLFVGSTKEIAEILNRERK